LRKKLIALETQKHAIFWPPLGSSYGSSHFRGVRRYRVLRPIDDPNYVMINLEFDSTNEAEAYLAALRRVVYSSQEAAPASGSGPQTRIVEVVETKAY
jgi:hypothetical protein